MNLLAIRHFHGSELGFIQPTFAVVWGMRAVFTNFVVIVQWDTNEYIHAITEEYFKDPWLGLSLHYSRDSTTLVLPKEKTAGVQPILATPLLSAAFNSYQTFHSSPLPTSPNIITHSEERSCRGNRKPLRWVDVLPEFIFYYWHKSDKLKLICTPEN